jgi:hypothetical protein
MMIGDNERGLEILVVIYTLYSLPTFLRIAKMKSS